VVRTALSSPDPFHFNSLSQGDMSPFVFPPFTSFLAAPLTQTSLDDQLFFFAWCPVLPGGAIPSSFRFSPSLETLRPPLIRDLLFSLPTDEVIFLCLPTGRLEGAFPYSWNLSQTGVSEPFLPASALNSTEVRGFTI